LTVDSTCTSPVTSYSKNLSSGTKHFSGLCELQFVTSALNTLREVFKNTLCIAFYIPFRLLSSSIS